MPLVIDLLRHGAAEPTHPAGDRARALTALGQRAAAALGRTLRAEGWRPTEVFVSPLVRARQTARSVLDEAGIDLEPIVLDELTPDHDPADAIRAVREHGGTKGHVLLVGHQPLMGRLAHWLSGTETAPAPCELTRLEFADGLAAGGGRLVRVIAGGH